jgi:hypothetical protein
MSRYECRLTMTQREREITKAMQNINTTRRLTKHLLCITLQVLLGLASPSLTGRWIPEHCAQGQLQCQCVHGKMGGPGMQMGVRRAWLWAHIHDVGHSHSVLAWFHYLWTGSGQLDCPCVKLRWALWLDLSGDCDVWRKDEWHVSKA